MHLPSQSRIESLIEAWANIGSGFFISLFMWICVVTPLWGLKTSMLDNLGIVLLFTITSVLRSYVWRRWFNRRLHAKLEDIFETKPHPKLSDRG